MTRPGRRLLMAVIVAAVVASVVGVVSPSAVQAAQPFDARFPRVGTITFSNCQPTCAAPTQQFGFSEVNRYIADGLRRRFLAYNPQNFAAVEQGIAVIDADELEQTGWISLDPEATPATALPSSRFDATVYDERRGRLFLGETSKQFGCAAEGVPVPPTGCAVPPRFAVVNTLATAPVPVVVNLPTAAQWLDQPQQHKETFELDTISSLAYWSSSDGATQRLYLLTTSGDTFDGLTGEPKGVAVVAYDAANLTATSKPLWAYRMRACPAAMNDRSRPGQPYFDVGNDGSFVYFVCRGVSGQAIPHGVMRVNLDPSATADPTAKFNTEFFNFPGQALSAFSSGDRGNDRAAIGVTGVGAQRFYVFDAGRRAWIASMLMGGFNTGGAGADPVSGRVYVASQNFGIRYLDASAMPPKALPEGFTYGFDQPGLYPTEFAVDPITRRIPLPPPAASGYVNGDEPTKYHIWIFEDRTEPFVPAIPGHPDDDTHDFDEDKAVQVSHTAFGSAYGAHLVSVGGVGSTGPTENANKTLGANEATAPLRLESGDRGLFLSQIKKAELTGESDRGEASATAAALTIDPATSADLRGKYGWATARFGVGGDDSPPCDRSDPGPECLAYDEVAANAGELEEASCSDFGGGDGAVKGDADGSHVSCTRLDTVEASSQASLVAPTGAGPVTFAVGGSSSSVKSVKDPAGGVITTTTATARDVVVTAAGVGQLSIGEVESVATSYAKGRPTVGGEPGAHSTLETRARNVVIRDAAGVTKFSCGVPGAADNAGGGDQCDPAEAALGINRFLAPRLVARGPRQDTSELTTGSPKGARAQVVKDVYAYLNDSVINGDAQREVTALDITFYNDFDAPSRLTLHLAGVYSEAQYIIGALKPPVVTDPTKLTVSLIDGDSKPLAGGVFQVRRAGGGDDALAALSGELIGACTTADDGIGNCQFDDLEPGDYVISETAAPMGYARSADAEITLLPEQHTEATFTNLRSLGSIVVSLHADGAPLPGAVFGIVTDNGDLVPGPGDQPYGVCVTGPSGACRGDDVPLGPYVVVPLEMPAGYLMPDPAGFELKQPGEVAELAFTTGLEGIDGSTDEAPPEEAPVEEEPPSEPPQTAFVDQPTETTEVMILESPQPIANVTSAPIDRPGIVRRLARVPAEVASFLRRKPGQAVLFGLVWLLLGSPLYLAVRRRSLTLAKVAI